MAAGAQDWHSYLAHLGVFQPCTPSEPPIVSLTLSMAQPRLGFVEPRVRVSLRNLTGRQLAVVMNDTLGMFSATVLDGRGGRVSLQESREEFYRIAAKTQAELGPLYLASGSGVFHSILAPRPGSTNEQSPTSAPAATPLPVFPEYLHQGRNPNPQAEISWEWEVGQDFVISSPGTYRIRLGGSMEGLNTVVCSNTLEMKLYAVTNEGFDQVLRAAGVSAFDEESLASALKNPRPDVRSAAAEKLAYETETGAIPAIAEALAMEWDAQTKQTLKLALAKLGRIGK